ncbi:MAG: exodeoxyribonuclease VII small subunit [Calditrichaeota bacterium]|nr:exodeoxyribonuclease VII small subunit [Calditrichota bacterium]
MRLPVDRTGLSYARRQCSLPATLLNCNLPVAAPLSRLSESSPVNSETPAAGTEPSFEDAYRRLEAIARKLEEPATPLEESFRLFDEGQQLLRYCERLLDQAERRIQVIVGESSGEVREETIA